MTDHPGMTEHAAIVNGIPVRALYSREAVDTVFIPLLNGLSELWQKKGKRILVMLAAPPGCGKTTLLTFLEKLWRDRGIPGILQTIGMDGFHLRQEYLLSHTVVRDGAEIPMVRVKGAPITFDLEKLADRAARIASSEICLWPVYDRMLHNPTEDALTVDGDVILLEGNYLLLDEDGWRDLSSLADFTVSVKADEGMLRSRLIERRIKTGVDRESAVRFVDFSDMPNVRLCLEKTMPADLNLMIDEHGDYRVSGRK